jgi:hypothetical protein
MSNMHPLIKEFARIESEVQFGHLRPIWWDGFCNVVIKGETSGPDDNPYQFGHHNSGEDLAFTIYEEGAKAGESLLKRIASQESNLNKFRPLPSGCRDLLDEDEPEDADEW